MNNIKLQRNQVTNEGGKNVRDPLGGIPRSLPIPTPLPSSCESTQFAAKKDSRARKRAEGCNPEHGIRILDVYTQKSIIL